MARRARLCNGFKILTYSWEVVFTGFMTSRIIHYKLKYSEVEVHESV